MLLFFFFGEKSSFFLLFVEKFGSLVFQKLNTKHKIVRKNSHAQCQAPHTYPCPNSGPKSGFEMGRKGITLLISYKTMFTNISRIWNSSSSAANNKCGEHFPTINEIVKPALTTMFFSSSSNSNSTSTKQEWIKQPTPNPTDPSEGGHWKMDSSKKKKRGRYTTIAYHMQYKSNNFLAHSSWCSNKWEQNEWKCEMYFRRFVYEHPPVKWNRTRVQLINLF